MLDYLLCRVCNVDKKKEESTEEKLTQNNSQINNQIVENEGIIFGWDFSAKSDKALSDNNSTNNIISYNQNYSEVQSNLINNYKLTSKLTDVPIINNAPNVSTLHQSQTLTPNLSPNFNSSGIIVKKNLLSMNLTSTQSMQSPRYIASSQLSNKQFKEISFSSNLTFANNKKKYSSRGIHDLIDLENREDIKSPNYNTSYSFAKSGIGVDKLSPKNREYLENLTNKKIMEYIEEKSVLEDSSFDLYNFNVKYNEQKTKNKTTLTIYDITGNLLNKDILQVGPFGLVNSIRKKKNGITFFGFLSSSSKSQNEKDSDSDNLIDFALNSSILDEFKEKIPNPLFAINYNSELNDYYFNYCKKKDIKLPSLILIKLDKSFIITKKEVINISSFYFEIEAESNKITITKMESNTQGTIKEKLTFNAQTVSEITVGRSKDCTISIDSKQLSRVNFTIKYFKIKLKDILKNDASNNKNIYFQMIDKDVSEESLIRFWKLYDGSIDKASTNGLWLFSNNSYPIYDGFTIRLGRNKIQINRIESFDN